jgi:hypothetical protein
MYERRSYRPDNRFQARLEQWFSRRSAGIRIEGIPHPLKEGTRGFGGCRSRLICRRLVPLIEIGRKSFWRRLIPSIEVGGGALPVALLLEVPSVSSFHVGMTLIRACLLVLAATMPTFAADRKTASDCRNAWSEARKDAIDLM